MIHNSSLKFDTRGLEKFSLVEWPGKIAAIIFTGGCNFRCPFCHNPELTNVGIRHGAYLPPPAYPWPEIEKFLDKKIGWIDVIIITGGEPTIQPDLPRVLKIIKDKGYLTGIHTNGTIPKMLEKILAEKTVDKICMDIKSSLEKYSEASGVATAGATHELPLQKQIVSSIEIIKNSGINYEFKLTLVPDIVTEEDIPMIGKMIKGAKKISLQQFRPLKTLDKSYQNKVPYEREKIVKMGKMLEKCVEEVNLDFIE